MSNHIRVVMNMEDFGRLIQKRRRVLRLDQRTLGDIIGVAVHTLSNIESGKGNPTLETLNKICEPLGLELVVRVKSPSPRNQRDG